MKLPLASLLLSSILVLAFLFYRSQRLRDGILRHEIGAFCESLGYRPDSAPKETVFSKRYRKEPLCVFWEAGQVLEAYFVFDILLKEYPAAVYWIDGVKPEDLDRDDRTLEDICKHSLLVTNSFVNRGVFLLSDEGCSKHCRNITRPFADYIIRNYWCEAMNTHKDAYYVPLGYASPFTEPNENAILPCPFRRFTASFKGSLKADRSLFIEYLKNSSIYNESRFLVQATKDFHQGDPAYQFRGLLLNSQIAPCPAGNNPEQFRIWEALSTASIPILQRGETFSKLPANHPLIIVDNVKEMVRKIEWLSNEPLEMMKAQCTTFLWWLSYKKTLQRQIVELILNGRHLQWQ
ncbi:hypothetical protein GAYE_HTGSCF06PCTG21G0291 [Galdieria yellowstonensis]|uniref:RXYLT1 C-terminal domain-containing protein n=1 Tax=Galdieria yellowstonensis TaxID=3028027 RepID=A0AAV9I6B3_9RHOD|nr:hypothetical protein GAYE_HTGSCF06PCTG21G0291 [Galdieria yellowstonensis]